MTMRFGAVLRVTAAAALVTALLAPAADARPGSRGSSGSRGSATNSAPPPTATAPGAAQPMQRTQAPTTAAPQRPATAAPATASRGLGFGGGLMAGLLGAGLLGMLFGGGFMGGLGGLASMLGLLLQVALIVGVVFLAIRFFRRRQEPALAGAGAPAERSMMGGDAPRPGMFGGGGQPAQPVRQPIQIVQEDYQAFERSLGEIQLAYGREDIARLQQLATPEMSGYFQQDLEADRARGIRNEVRDPKLLQGDLSEAWREGGTEYATVAMRFSLTDVEIERATGKVVAQNPSEATELWTFRRDGSSPWLLSAIQQTA